MTRRSWATVWVALATVPLALTAGCGAEEDPAPRDDAETRPSADPRALPGLPDVDSAREQLAALTVAEAASMEGYSRDRFPHWNTEDGCTVRQQVLQRDGEDVRVDDDCQPTSGTWVSPYDNVTVTEAGEVDIDHMVPLANAWRSGADEWNDEEREEFANDLTRPQLLAASARSNRAKGDQGPEAWTPEAEEFHCDYGRAWTAVKHHYDLTVTDAEEEKLGELLDTCG
ncbi:HNH endonuclease family protein [Streptomyces sedi]|uniref:HNH endonuclease n=1 Tax=Streptomyces sedi TaxID=555059 RepID=A0A5C4USQ5_9ACTN|nr:HNH endonuclease family protein [Streptomyces sedi]TNM26661.1 HNH endonuclease [Streptomyces sedi]